MFIITVMDRATAALEEALDDVADVARAYGEFALRVVGYPD
jgi:hypothetical protein